MTTTILLSSCAVAWVINNPFRLILILLSAASFTTYAIDTPSNKIIDEQVRLLPYATMTLSIASCSSIVLQATSIDGLHQRQ